MTRDRKLIPSWSSPLEAVALIARGYTFKTASKVAIVVGTLLTLVNQATVIAAGHVGPVTWVRVGFNYAIPYTVASIGYLAPFRRREAAPVSRARRRDHRSEGDDQDSTAGR
jgi:hypothetical protein